MNVSLASVAVNYLTAYTLIHKLHFGVAGLALSTSTVALVNFAVLLLLLRFRIGGLDGRLLALNFVKISLASAVMAGFCWMTSTGVRHWLGLTFQAQLLDLAVSIPVGGAAFYGACYWLKVPELEDAEHAVARPLLRRLGIVKKPHVKLAE
jgi:putative peptidoglycan lipid II flippase